MVEKRVATHLQRRLFWLDEHHMRHSATCVSPRAQVKPQLRLPAEMHRELANEPDDNTWQQSSIPPRYLVQPMDAQGRASMSVGMASSTFPARFR